MSNVTVSAIAAGVLSSLVVLPAYAGPTGTATHLLPLESSELTAEIDHERFDRVEDAINNPQPEEKSSATLDLGSLGGLVDENGEFSLPLGIRVFSTMGDPSVGFGGTF